MELQRVRHCWAHVHGLRVWVHLWVWHKRNCFIMATISKYLLYSWMKGVWNICSINDNEWRRLCDECFYHFFPTSFLPPEAMVSTCPKVDFGPELAGSRPFEFKLPYWRVRFYEYDGKLFVQHHKGNDIYLYSPSRTQREKCSLDVSLMRKISPDLQRPAILGAITLQEEPTNCFCLPVLVHHGSHLILIFHFMLSDHNLSNSGFVMHSNDI